MERIRAESFVVRTKSVIVLSRLVDRAEPTPGPRCPEVARFRHMGAADQLKSSTCRSLSKIRARTPDGSGPSSSAATKTPRGPALAGVSPMIIAGVVVVIAVIVAIVIAVA